TAGSEPRVCPPSLNEFAVPAEQRLRRDEDRSSALARKQAADGGEVSTIGGSQPRLADLPSQDPQLMPKHQQLDVLGVLGAPAANEQLQKGSKSEIGEREEHPGMLPGSLPPAVSGQIRVL